MAVIYCRSTDGNDADNGSTWALAKATLQAAVTAAGNGGTVYVSKNHSEFTSGAANTLDGPTSVANRVYIYAVDDTSDPEPPTTLTDKDSVTTAVFGVSASSEDIVVSGHMHIYGVEFRSATGGTYNSALEANNAIDTSVVFEACHINLNTDGASGGRISVGGSSNSSINRTLSFRNCDFTFGNTATCFNVDAGGNIVIDGGAFLAVGVSVDVFDMNPGADRSCVVRVSNFDMSAVTADDYFVKAASTNQLDCLMKRVKFPASYAGIVNTVSGLTLDGGIPPVRIHGYGTADQYYQFYEAGQQGEAEESTSVYRSGGATYDGTNEFSAKLIASAAATYALPLRFKLAELKLDLTTAKTLTVHTCQNAGTVYQDDEFWIEVDHPDSTDLALGVNDSTRVAPLASPANLTSSAETWTASGSEDKRQVAVTISSITGATDAQVTVWACLGKPSGEIYVCPKVEVS